MVDPTSSLKVGGVIGACAAAGVQPRPLALRKSVAPAGLPTPSSLPSVNPTPGRNRLDKRLAPMPTAGDGVRVNAPPEQSTQSSEAVVEPEKKDSPQTRQNVDMLLVDVD